MTYSRMDIEIERAAGYAMPVMKECNSGEWLKEVKRRIERLEVNLAVCRNDAALAEARELIAASQILYGEIVNEQGALR
jgi:hypothetical protein